MRDLRKTCLEPRTLDYAAMGRFSERVGRYLAVFPVEQVRVIRFHDWTADPRAAYLEILDFLGLDDDGPKFPRINQGVTYRSRRLVRFILYPPVFVRKVARLIKPLTGLQGVKIYPAVRKVVNLLSAPGYKGHRPTGARRNQALLRARQPAAGRAASSRNAGRNPSSGGCGESSAWSRILDSKTNYPTSAESGPNPRRLPRWI